MQIDIVRFFIYTDMQIDINIALNVFINVM